VVVTDGKWDTACGRMLLMLTVTEDGDGFSGVGHLGRLNSLGSVSLLAVLASWHKGEDLARRQGRRWMDWGTQCTLAHREQKATQALHRL
jgi:hypothetical protein